MEANLKHTISLLVSNKPGVLTRIALVFARRNYNIDSLVVSQSQTKEFSRVNIEATGEENTLHLMLRQLNRLIDIVHAVDHAGDDVIQRELALFKIRCESDRRIEILHIADTFRCRTVDLSERSATFQITGKTDKINAFKSRMHEYGIMELVRTGKVIMSRGEEITA